MEIYLFDNDNNKIALNVTLNTCYMFSINIICTTAVFVFQFRYWEGGLALYSPHISLSCVNCLGKLNFSSGEPHHHHHHPLQVTWANPVVWAIERPSVAGRVAQSQLEKLFCLQIGQHSPEKVSPELSAEIHLGVDSSSNYHWFLGT